MEYVVVDERALPAGGVICAIILALGGRRRTRTSTSTYTTTRLGYFCPFSRRGTRVLSVETFEDRYEEMKMWKFVEACSQTGTAAECYS